MKSSFFKILILFSLTLSISINALGFQIDSVASPKLWLEEQSKIGYNFLRVNQEFDKAVHIFKSAQDFAISQKRLDEFTNISIGYGIALYKNGDIQNAYIILHEVQPKIKNSEPKIKAEVNQILGMTLVFKNKFPEGYKYQMDALKYYMDIQDSLGMVGIYYDLGANFGTQGQAELALENYEKGIAIAKALKDNKLSIIGTTAIGGTWASLNNFEKAIEYIDESMVFAKLLKDDEELAWASVNGGHILGNLKKYKKAEQYLQQAYDLSFKIGNKLLTAYAVEQMSDLSLKQNQLNKALRKLDESYVIFKELGQTNSMKGVAKKYAEIYYKKQDFVKYKEYNDQYMMLKDSIYSKDMMESMASLKQDFEIHRLEKENHIALLTKDKELAKAKYKSRIAISVAGLMVFILLLSLMYSRNKAAIEKNEILLAKNAEIIRQNTFLAESNRDLEKFAYIISHDLKEPLRNINGFTKLLIRKLKKTNIDESISEYASFITNGTEQMEGLLNGLLEYSKIGVSKGEREIVNMNHLVNRVANSLKIQLNEKKCEIEIGELPILACRSSQMTQVFQNLIANAIKFSDENGNKIKIAAEELENDYQFSVRDNGIGIDLEYQKDIFVVFKRLHNRGTYSGSGIGLATCKKIVEDHGGRIWVSSKKGEGACFYFNIPKISTSKFENQKEQPTIEEFEIA